MYTILKCYGDNKKPVSRIKIVPPQLWVIGLVREIEDLFRTIRKPYKLEYTDTTSKNFRREEAELFNLSGSDQVTYTP